MKCARRLAGARKPAPPTGSPRKSEPRTGRRRARLSGLLPALALLLGALSLFTVAPAQAQTQDPPRNVQVTPGDAKLTLTWQAPSSWAGAGERHFEVEWRLSSAGTTSIQPPGGSTLHANFGSRIVSFGRADETALLIGATGIFDTKSSVCVAWAGRHGDNRGPSQQQTTRTFDGGCSASV